MGHTIGGIIILKNPIEWFWNRHRHSSTTGTVMAEPAWTD
jgi:hypothetical protein